MKTDTLEAMLDELVEKKQIRHAVIGVETGDGSSRWIGAAGVADPDGTPMHGDTPYFTASVTKLFVAAAVLKLHEQGKVHLDDAIDSLFPEQLVRGLHRLRGVDYTKRITVAHLLTHTSGLPDWLDDPPRHGRALLDSLDLHSIEGDEDRFIGIEQVVEYVKTELRPHFPPQDLGADKQRVRYSDTNYQLLELLIGQATGLPLHAAFTQLLYEPVGLRDTFHPGHKPRHLREPATFWAADTPFRKPLLIESFRDIYSTADDQLGFMRALITGALFEDAKTATA